MSNLICTLYGVRGRSIEIYDNKCIIRTEMTAGSILTGNATDGEKTLFYIDCVGIQFKESKATIGYLQVETSSMQMNNQTSNYFSENSFTFEQNKNGLNNMIMRQVYNFISERVEGYKYGTAKPITEAPDYLKAALSGVPGALPIPVVPGQQPYFTPAIQAPQAAQTPQAPRTQTGSGWVCSCGHRNAPSGSFCVQCGSPRR